MEQEMSKVEKRIRDLLTAISEWKHTKKLADGPKKTSSMFRRHIDWEQLKDIMSQMGYKSYSVDEMKKDFNSVCKVVVAEKTLDTILAEADSVTEKIARREMTTGFKLFSAEKTGRFQKKFPSYPMTKIFKKVTDEWTSLSIDKKDVYNKKAEKINADNGFSKVSGTRKRNSSSSHLKKLKFPSRNLTEFYMSKHLLPKMEGTLKENGSALKKEAIEVVSKMNPKELSKLEKEYLECKESFVLEFEKLSNVEKQLTRGQFLNKKNITVFSKDPILGYLFDDSKEKPIFDLKKLNDSKLDTSVQFHDIILQNTKSDDSSDSSVDSSSDLD